MRKGTKRFSNLGIAALFAGPSLLVFAAVVVLPFLFGIFLTFTDWDGHSLDFVFTGLANYREAVHDGVFWTSLWLTLRYAFFTVVLTNALAFFLAYLLTGGIRGSSFLRAGFFTPNLIGGIILGLVWQFVFSRVVTAAGSALGIAALSRSALSNPDGAFWAMVIVTVWQYSGYMMVIYIAGLQGVPAELVEAASIEGADAWQKLRSVIIPLIVPSIIVCTFLTIQRSFMVYEINLSLTAGGPYQSSVLVAMNVYQTAFLSRKFGLGQAEAVTLFAIIVLISLVQVYLGKKREIEL